MNRLDVKRASAKHRSVRITKAIQGGMTFFWTLELYGRRSPRSEPQPINGPGPIQLRILEAAPVSEHNIPQLLSAAAHGPTPSGAFASRPQCYISPLHDDNARVTTKAPALLSSLSSSPLLVFLPSATGLLVNHVRYCLSPQPKRRQSIRIHPHEMDHDPVCRLVLGDNM